MDLLPPDISLLTVIIALVVAGVLSMALSDFFSFGKSKFIVDGRVRIVNYLVEYTLTS